MKKLLSLGLILCLTAGLFAACAKQAASPPGTEPAGTVSQAVPAQKPAPVEEKAFVSYADVGVDLPMAADQPETTGGTRWNSYGLVGEDPGITILELQYFAMPREESEISLQKYLDQTISEKETERLLASYGAVGYVVGCSGTLEDAIRYFEGESVSTELGAAEGYHFWFLTFPGDDAAYLAGIEEPYAGEFRKLQTELPSLLASGRFYAPLDPLAALVGQTIRFTTADLDGNTVTSEELFAQNEITMINVWATWCGPCKGELAELAEIHERLQARGCGIIGIVTDGDEANAAANALISQKGIGYPNVVQSGDMSFLRAIAAIPTSIFVDRNGRILTDPIVGAQVDAYEPAVEALLAGSAADSGPAAEKGVYRIFVRDADGNAVRGAKVQFCSDTDCRFAETDDTGLVTFEAEAAVYSVHVLKAPEGFLTDDTEYWTTESFDDLTITLQRERP